MRTSEFSRTGTRNSLACPAMSGQPSTALSATAPPGGCRQRSSDMTSIAAETASAAARAGEPTACATHTPISADAALPPAIDHGWASGLDGTAKRRTADAPIGAMIHGIETGTIAAQVNPARPMPTSAPMLAIIRSRKLAPASSGEKNRLGPDFATRTSSGRGPMQRGARRCQRGLIFPGQAGFSGRTRLVLEQRRRIAKPLACETICSRARSRLPPPFPPPRWPGR